MQRVGITVSVTHRTSAQHDLGMRGLAAVVRASVHAYNNTEELERSVEAVAQIASGRRSR
jgi:selenocysteine lyase/cysteine desulfurase